MANTYKWNVVNIEAYPTLETYENVVSKVDWRCTATDDATPPHTAIRYGIQPINFVAPTANTTFTPFDQLTEEVVMTWVQSSIGEMMISSIYAGLDNDINRQLTPQPVKFGLPWSPVVTNTVTANTSNTAS